MLYAALALEPPAFAHVPLILNADRTKMSKRGGEASVAVGDWREAGFVPDALLSYLALLGFHPGDDREILSRAELLQAFTLDRVGRSGSVFDPAKLRWVNAHYLHAMSGAELLRAAAIFLPDDALERGRERLESLLEAVRSNLTTLADLRHELEPFLLGKPRFELEAGAVLVTESARRVCRELAGEIEPLEEWNGEVFKSAVQSVGKRLGLKGRDLYQPIRAALTGRIHGPELPLVAELLGKQDCSSRLTAILGEG
jgi:glutamyl/glutaminyl-tRNA synthetase